MGLNQVGFGLQNHQNQWSIQAGTMIWMNRFPTGLDSCDKLENLIECFLKSNESKKKKKRYMILSPNEGDMTKTSSGAPYLNLLE